MPLGLSIIIFLITPTGCQKRKTEPDPTWPGNFLPANIGKDILRTSEIATYTADSLWEYIDGGAELFLKYDFKRVSRTDYGDGEMQISIDIFQFEDPSGPRSVLKEIYPDFQDTVLIFDTGVLSESSYDFAVENYLVRLIAYEKSAAVPKILKDVGAEIKSLILATTDSADIFSNTRRN